VCVQHTWAYCAVQLCQRTWYRWWCQHGRYSTQPDAFWDLI